MACRRSSFGRIALSWQVGRSSARLGPARQGGLLLAGIGLRCVRLPSRAAAVYGPLAVWENRCDPRPPLAAAADDSSTRHEQRLGTVGSGSIAAAPALTVNLSTPPAAGEAGAAIGLPQTRSATLGTLAGLVFAGQEHGEGGVIVVGGQVHVANGSGPGTRVTRGIKVPACRRSGRTRDSRQCAPAARPGPPSPAAIRSGGDRQMQNSLRLDEAQAARRGAACPASGRSCRAGVSPVAAAAGSSPVRRQRLLR